MFRIFALLVLLPISLSAREYSRDYTSSDGSSLRATLINANAEKVILERSSDGRQFTLPLDRLSESDQEYIKAWVVKNVPFEHPLGWKRLTLFGAHGTGMMSGNSITPITPDGKTEVYLPVGSWVRVTSKDMSVAFKQFQGEPAWYISYSGGSKILIGTEPGKPGAVAGFAFHDGEAGNANEAEQPSLKEALDLIKRGSSVHCMDAKSIRRLVEKGARPSALILWTRENLDWASFPNSLMALRWSAGDDVDFKGIEALADLEHLSLNANKNGEGAHRISNTESLAALAALKSLTLHCVVEPKDLAPFGELKNLRHLKFQEESKQDAFAPEDFNFLAKLTELETLDLGGHYIRDKIINPAVLKNCPRLTEYSFRHGSDIGGGEFLRALPNLTELDFGGGLVKREVVDELMENGHFKHVRVLKATSNYTLKNFPELRRLRLGGLGRFTRILKSGPLPKLQEMSFTSTKPEEIERLSTVPFSRGVEKIQFSTGGTGSAVAALKNFPALVELEIFYLKEGEPIDLDFSQFPNLRVLRIFASRSIGSISGIGSLNQLEISGCHVLKLGDGDGGPELDTLVIEGVGKLATLEDLGDCPKLRLLKVRSCPDLKSTGDIEKSPSLRTVEIRHNSNVADYSLEKDGR